MRYDGLVGIRLILRSANAARFLFFKKENKMSDKTPEQLEKERLADHNKRNKEVMDAQAKCRPTPTIEEVQKALAGEPVDDKEPDGSPEQHVHPVEVKKVDKKVEEKPVEVKKVAEPEVHHDGSYKTRVSKKDDR